MRTICGEHVHLVVRHELDYGGGKCHNKNPILKQDFAQLG